MCYYVCNWNSPIITEIKTEDRMMEPKIETLEQARHWIRDHEAPNWERANDDLEIVGFESEDEEAARLADIEYASE